MDVVIIITNNEFGWFYLVLDNISAVFPHTAAGTSVTNVWELSKKKA